MKAHLNFVNSATFERKGVSSLKGQLKGGNEQKEVYDLIIGAHIAM